MPSNGIHSNGYSLIRSLIKNRVLTDNLKKELLKPTKIYVKEILKLSDKKIINAAAHITGGGLIENLLRSIPEKLTLNVDLSKIRIKKIFKWIKKRNISDKEMLSTFNCGVGFCIITNPKNENRVKRFFSKEFKPYKIGYISKNNMKVNVLNKLKW